MEAVNDWRGEARGVRWAAFPAGGGGGKGERGGMGTLFGFDFLFLIFWPSLSRTEAAPGCGCAHNSRVVVAAGEGGKNIGREKEREGKGKEGETLYLWKTHK